MVRMGAARSGKSLYNLKAEQSKFDVWMDDLRERENSRMPARMPQWSAFATGGSCHLLSSPWLKGDKIFYFIHNKFEMYLRFPVADTV